MTGQSVHYYQEYITSSMQQTRVHVVVQTSLLFNTFMQAHHRCTSMFSVSIIDHSLAVYYIEARIPRVKSMHHRLLLTLTYLSFDMGQSTTVNQFCPLHCIVISDIYVCSTDHHLFQNRHKHTILFLGCFIS